MSNLTMDRTNINCTMDFTIGAPSMQAIGKSLFLLYKNFFKIIKTKDIEFSVGLKRSIWKSFEIEKHFEFTRKKV